MKRKKTFKRILISVIAIVLVAAMGGGAWYYFGHASADPVYVFPFNYLGMTEYWGDTLESYGPISTDRMQTVYLSNTQTVTQIFVQPGDEVQKGDILMSFDTTLDDLALERSRLGVEKLKLQLEDAEKRLREINRMVPMYIPAPTPTPSEPEDENRGIPLTDAYRVVSKSELDGSKTELAMICWLNSGTNIDNQLFAALREIAQELYAKNQAENAEAGAAPASMQFGTDGLIVSTLSSDNTGFIISLLTNTDSGDEPSSEPTTAPTTPPTEATTPSEEPTVPPTDPSAPTDPPDTPVIPEISSYYVIFKVTDGNMSLGQTLIWQGVHVTRSGSGYTFRFFDASGIPDSSKTENTPENTGPQIQFNSGYTAAQIAQLRSEQEKTIKDLEFQIKMAEADYKIKQTEVGDGNVYAAIDGVVVSALSEEEAKLTMQPIIKVSGGGGFYVQGSVSELNKDQLIIGQEVTVNDWSTGMVYTGIVQEIGDYPTDRFGYSGMGNPNSSYYPFTVYIDGDADLMEGRYVDIQFSAGEAKGGIYLQNPFIREENGKSYVYILGEDGKLEKRFVTTGKALWGSYTEILSGLSETDLIAFPYGKNVAEGTPALEGDLSNLYNY